MSIAGFGLDNDISRVVRLYTSSASSGSVAVRNNLAYCYCDGLGVAKDEGKLRRCIRNLLKLGMLPLRVIWDTVILMESAFLSIK